MGAKHNGSSSGGTKNHCWKINGQKQHSTILGGTAKWLYYATLEQDETCFRKAGSQELGQGKDEIESKSVPGKTNLSEDDVAMSEAGVGKMIVMPIRCDGQRQRALSLQPSSN